MDNNMNDEDLIPAHRFYINMKHDLLYVDEQLTSIECKLSEKKCGDVLFNGCLLEQVQITRLSLRTALEEMDEKLIELGELIEKKFGN